MSLQDRLEQDLKTAMREGDSERRTVIRYIRSEIHNQEIARKGELDDEALVTLLGRQAQQRRDSIEAFKKGNRQDLVAKEEAELATILEYLPQQLSEAEIRDLAQRAISDIGATGPQEMGRVMGHLMPQVQGRANGRAVSAVVSELLKGLAG